RPLSGERRLATGVPAIEHALGVAALLAELRLDQEGLAAAVLFPGPGHAPENAAGVWRSFGRGVADLADGVGRMGEIGALSSHSREESGSESNFRLNSGKTARKIDPDPSSSRQLEALRKMLLAMVQDVRVVLIKLADHTQELRHRVGMPDSEHRRNAAQVTRDIFAPLANRLGVWQLKWELEDLALRILEPATYQRIARLLDEKRATREQYLENVVALLQGEMRRAGIEAEVTGRPKHIFSIYEKMQSKGSDFEHLYDVRDVRILVTDVASCYAALGLVHSLWSPIPKEFDGYIAKPKSNQYRSLHTAVIGPEGKALEVQIRTHEMHQHSELGVAA